MSYILSAANKIRAVSGLTYAGTFLDKVTLVPILLCYAAVLIIAVVNKLPLDYALISQNSVNKVLWWILILCLMFYNEILGIWI